MNTYMFRSHPLNDSIEVSALIKVLDALGECVQDCAVCADACLAEDMVSDLRTCIRLNLDCADICAVTARVVERQVGGNAEAVKAQLEACVLACAACGTECERHAGMHEHCRICGETCRRCEQACREYLSTL